MKTNILAVTVLAATVFAVGCKPAKEPSPNDKPVTEGMETASQQLEKASKETKEAASAINEYAYAQRMEFADKMKAKLADINKELDLLAVKLETANEDVKTEGKAKLQALRDKVSGLDKQLDGIKDASESTWDDIKSGFNKSYDEVKDSFNQARQWLSDKIAP
jgi:chromosome segregation ATPase